MKAVARFLIGAGMIAIAVAAVLTFLFVVDANSQTLCGDRATLADAMRKSKFHEVLAFTAKTEGVAMDFYLNPATGTWSVVYINANGLACIRVVGTDFRLAPQSIQGDPS